MPWDPNRTAHWQPGDRITNALTGRTESIRSIRRYGSYDAIRTTDGRNIIGEAVDHWDLELPNLDFATTSKDTPLDRIIELVVSNFKRIKVATIRPDPNGSIVRISGGNGEGKSSILDAIQTALVGPAAMPTVPVRVGQDMAEINIDCGDVQIRRRIMPDGHGTLKITTKDGMSPAKPQTWLNERIGAIAFDPLSFLDQDGKAQAETIRRLASCDVSDLDAERQRVFDERAAVKRDLKNAEGARNSLPALADGVPDAELTPLGVLAEIDKAQAAEKRITAIAAELDNIRLAIGFHEDQQTRDEATIDEITRGEAEAIDEAEHRSAVAINTEKMRLETLDAQTRDDVRVAEQQCDEVIAELEARLVTLRAKRLAVGFDLRAAAEVTRAESKAKIKRLEEQAVTDRQAHKAAGQKKRQAVWDRMAAETEKAAALREKAIKAEEQRKGIVVMDVHELRQQLKTIEQTNAQVRIKARWAESDKHIEALQAEVSQRTERLEQIAAERQARIAAVKYPIDGLGFNDDGLLTFGGLPLEQASQAEQIRVSMAIGLAQKPELRVVLLRDASLLDAKSLAIVYAEAERLKAQIWVERCDVGGVEGEVIIEDGEVVGASS